MKKKQLWMNTILLYSPEYLWLLSLCTNLWFFKHASSIRVTQQQHARFSKTCRSWLNKRTGQAMKFSPRVSGNACYLLAPRNHHLPSFIADTDARIAGEAGSMALPGEMHSTEQIKKPTLPKGRENESVLHPKHKPSSWSLHIQVT